MKRLLFLVLILFSGAGSAFPAVAQDSRRVSPTWICTTEKAPWQDCSGLPLGNADAQTPDIVIDAAQTHQAVDGFGGAFNEKGWAALQVLPVEKREEVMKALFDPNQGAKFNLCRVPIGASDYALERYTLDETPQDFAMEHFSIERDRARLIPYIRAALRFQPGLKLWGSVWTPPTWMKTNHAFDGGRMRDAPEIYAAYALYLARFVEAYQAEGLNLQAVAIQNEPLIETHYPSCLWTPEQFLTFTKNYLGPVFGKRKVKAEIWLGTFQDNDYTKFPKPVLDDPEANPYISAVGLQWDGLASVAETRKNHPDKKIIQTETECGNWFWKPGYDPVQPQNDWAYGAYTWSKVQTFLEAGANAYMLWNMVLDETGKSIDAEKPWPQNSAIVVNTRTQAVTYTPMFYAFKHFSFFIQPGARLLKRTGPWAEAIAFKNPDGKIVLVMQNSTPDLKRITVEIQQKKFTLDLPAKSWSTLVFK